MRAGNAIGLVTCNLLLTAVRDNPDPTPTFAAMPTTPTTPTTALEAALERVGDRWSLLVVEALLERPRRFNELGEDLPGIAPNILSDRLRRLERERIVTATPYQQRPPRLPYALTADGRDLASVLRLLADWGARTGRAVRTAPPRAVRHPPRDPLVLPDLRRRCRRRRRRARERVV